MGKNKAISIAAKVLSAVLILGLIGGAVYLAYYFTNGFTTPPTANPGGNKPAPLTVLYEDKELSAKDELLLEPWEVHSFEVLEEGEFTVTVLSGGNSEEDFDIMIDGELHSWESGIELTRAFDLAQSGNLFTIEFDDRPLLQNILGKAYEGKEIGCPDADELAFAPRYTLLVQSEDGKRFEIGFTLGIGHPNGVEVTPEGDIIF